MTAAIASTDRQAPSRRFTSPASPPRTAQPSTPHAGPDPPTTKAIAPPATAAATTPLGRAPSPAIPIGPAPGRCSGPAWGTIQPITASATVTLLITPARANSPACSGPRDFLRGFSNELMARGPTCRTSFTRGLIGGAPQLD